MSAVSDRFHAIRDALRLIAQQPGRFYVAVFVSGAALALPLLAAALAYAALPAWNSAQIGPEVSVFVKLGASPRDLEALRARLAAKDAVRDVRLIPRDQAFAELNKSSALSTTPIEGRSNPLPDTLVARFAMSVEPATVDRVAAEVRQWNGVDDVEAEIGWFRRLARLRTAGQPVAFGLAGLTGLLVFTALISAALMAVQLRADEVRLLQLVGARPRFVRRPYAYAAALTLATGAALAIGVAWLVLELLVPRAGSLAPALSPIAVPPWFPIGFVLTAGIVGNVIGGLAAWTQMRRFRPW
jgi:cell division transport system permease protein